MPTSRGPRRVAIIAAMEREIQPLLRRWRREGRKFQRKSISVLEGYASEGTWIIVGGIGRKRAAVAAKVIVEYHQPDLIISAGLAGALRADIAAGAVCVPEVVFDSASGQKYSCLRDRDASGALVTAVSVLSREEKEKLGRRFTADAVDMEAAVVAEVAHAAGVPFIAVKAISDPLEFEIPPMDRFIDAAGQLDLLKLLGYAALRPRTWGPLNSLRKNSRAASEALARELEKIVAEPG